MPLCQLRNKTLPVYQRPADQRTTFLSKPHGGTRTLYLKPLRLHRSEKELNKGSTLSHTGPLSDWGCCYFSLTEVSEVGVVLTEHV